MSTTAVRRWRRGLVALALACGLLALHGLSHHGEHVPSTAVVASAHDGHATAGGEGEQPQPAPGAVELCAAMLLGAAVLLLARAGRHRTRPLVLLRRRPRPRPGLVRPVSRAHAPPDLWDLSVCRC